MAIIDFTDSIYDAQQGNQQAIRFLYDNTIQLFYKEANAFLRDKAAADRAIRDAYIFIFDHLNSLEDTSKFLLWANEVCKNTCISMLNDAGVFNERIPAEAINLGEISAASDYDAQINMDANMSPDYIQECLEAILSALPDNQRACAILWGEGYPIRSISRKLGISPVAVNYTLAYTLGNITNSINTLSANGLPLFNMEPIPYFLWLLMGYYQYYEPGEAVIGPESSFSNILRCMMPGEASVFAADFYEGSYDYESQAPVVNVQTSKTQSASDTSFSDFKGDELDVSAFIKPGTEIPVKEEQTSKESPEIIVFNPHRKETSEDSEKEENEVKSEDTSEDAAGDKENSKDNNQEIDSEGSKTDPAEKTPDADGEKKAEEAKDEKEVNPEESDTSNGSGEAGAVGAAAAGVAAATIAAAAGQAAQASEADKAGEDEKTDHDKMVDDILFGELATKDSAGTEKPKKRTGLIITLIVIIVVLCLIIAAMFLFKEQVNKILGFNLFNTTQVTGPETAAEPPTVEETTEEPATEEPATEEPTTEAPTTEAPTTEEPTTEEPTTEEVLGPESEFDVTINLGENALAMHATSGNDDERLLYIPAGEQVHITEVQDGWGHTTYDGQDGWIWMEYTKVAGNAPVQQPEEGTMLEQPEPYTLGYSEFGNELRLLPGSYSASFGQIPEGTEIMIEAYYEDTWSHAMYGYTTYDGHHGWVYLYSTAEEQPEE